MSRWVKPLRVVTEVTPRSFSNLTRWNTDQSSAEAAVTQGPSSAGATGHQNTLYSIVGARRRGDHSLGAKDEAGVCVNFHKPPSRPEYITEGPGRQAMCEFSQSCSLLPRFDSSADLMLLSAARVRR